MRCGSGHRGVSHDPAPDDLDGFAAQPGKPRIQPGDLGQLVEQVNHLLDPAHEIAGGQVSAAEDFLKVPPAGALSLGVAAA